MSLKQQNIRSSNNFDFLRLVAAILVIITHSYTLIGSEDVDFLSKLTSNSIQFSHLGVATFFIISGYLITQSCTTSASWKSYFWKRILRLLPGLFSVLLVCLFILGPIFSILSIKDYFSREETAKFLLSGFIYFQNYSLPGLFENNPVKSVNGSLWTLSYEFTLYICVFIANILGLLKKRKILLLMWLFFLGIRIFLGNRFFWYSYSSPFILGLNIQYFFEWSFYFLSGMLFFLYRDKKKIDIGIIIGLLFAYIIFAFWKQTEVLNILNYLLIPFLIMYFSFISSPVSRISKYGDFSFGIYIYAFPVQQTLIYYLGNNISVISLILLSILFTVPFAILSWHFIEKKALTLKHIVK
jgi:peptidoglycan/LPS O-acetylase OafA/YrhL